MMWLILSLTLALAAVGLAFSFIARRRGPAADEADVYRAQLIEIEQEEAAGLMSAEDARFARIEIKRRLAAVEDGPAEKGNEAMRRSEQVTLAAVVASVCLGSVWLYTLIGAPSLSTYAATPTGHPQAAVEPAPASGGAAIASVDDMIGRVEARLEEDPNDVEGWRMLGWSYFRTGNLARAEEAYARALELAPGDAGTSSAYGEVLVRLSGGRVTDEAVTAFNNALVGTPNDPRARFLLGLRKEQDGDPEGAIVDWLALLDTANPGDDWANDVRSRVVELTTLTDATLPDGFEAAATLAPPSGPTAADMAAAEDLSPEDRAAMIQNMVAGLDARLQDDPNDLAGWMQLIRSYRVLNDTGRAQEAYARAQLAFAHDERALAELETAAISSLQ